MNDRGSFFLLFNKAFLLYPLQEIRQNFTTGYSSQKNAYACQHPPRQGVLLYGNAWGGLFIVVGRLAMPLVR
ncbi:MAG: hypothetical protein IJ442_02065 [Bacteroidaceae bacterium]|nr:hypothetical protein [Bacteroidaceae bacterium]